MKTAVGVLLAVALGVFTLWIVWPRSKVGPGILETSGQVEGDRVVVGAKVGGRITRLPVGEGQTLSAGAVIAELSSEQAKAQLEEAEHKLHRAREEVAQSLANVTVMEREVKSNETSVNLAANEANARIREAETALERERARLPQVEAERQRTEREYSRYQRLFAEDLIALKQVDFAKAAYQSAKMEEEVARQRISQAEASLKLARATVMAVELRRRKVEQARARWREAKAALDAANARVQSLEAARTQAQADVKDTRVLAPFHGIVLQKLVQEGQVVAAGSPLVTFVDISKLFVKVFVPEREVAKIRLGNEARVYVDVFPKRYFDAAVSEIAHQAQSMPRDVRIRDERVNLVFAVKLALKNPPGFLKPGMPVDAKIRWKPEGPWVDGGE
jgi:HlyD family secretion protein